jgi:hypothetical protein
MIDYEDAAKIVQKAIVRAGGYDEEHPKERTLKNAGLKTGNQRESFQRKVARGTEEYGHKIGNVSLIPNDESTKVNEVRNHIVDVAIPLAEGD